MSNPLGKRLLPNQRARQDQTDAYGQLVATGLGQAVAKRLGLPRPVALRRFAVTELLCDEPVLVASIGPDGEASADGGHLPAVLDRLQHLEIEVEAPDENTTRTRAAGDVEAPRLGGIVLDLSTVRTPEALAGFRALAAPAVKRLQPSRRTCTR